MFGGGIKRNDGLSAIRGSNTNIFSALESRRRKSGKKKSDNDDLKIKDTKPHREVQTLPQVWKPIQVSVKSWADCEDDDDYFATAAPLPAWGSDEPPKITEHAEDVSQEEESGNEEEAEEELDDGVEDEPQDELADSKTEVTLAQPLSVPITFAREPDRQLSKKEKKKKELEELEAVLAEFATDQKDTNGLAELGDEKKQGVVNFAINVKENIESGPALAESKNTKRRKAKKEKPFKEGKDEELPSVVDTDMRPKEIEVIDAEAPSVPADPKEVLKKLASLKKKKASKDIDTAAKAAAAEASARAVKLAAAKKKEKTHYNQQPAR